MSTVDLKVPDIGDFDDVEIIEILVAVGDTIAEEQSLITVESDKASMEIPAEQAGTVTEILVKIGDKVAQGSTIIKIDPSAAATTPAAEPVATPAAAPAAPVAAAASFSGAADSSCDVLVLGAGPGGYSAAFR